MRTRREHDGIGRVCGTAGQVATQIAFGLNPMDETSPGFASPLRTLGYENVFVPPKPVKPTADGATLTDVEVFPALSVRATVTDRFIPDPLAVLEP
jgi:hypothetical protein